MDRVFYFAYGSNMSSPRFVSRAPSAQFEGIGFLYGHRLCFHKVGFRDGSGKCDAYKTDSSGEYVAGVLYTIDRKHTATLHALEGVGAGYEIKDAEITMPSGSTVTAFTYYATRINPALKPFHWYKHHVLHGARQNSLPSEYIEQIQDVSSIDDPDHSRALKELSIYGEE